jgi:hypothetical protein
MTSKLEGQKETCWDCAHAERLVMAPCTLCTQPESDHFGHVLGEEHPACRWIKREWSKPQKEE